MNLSSTIKTAKNVITANSPVLLLGTSIAGVVTTGVLAAKAGYKARGIIDDERMRRVASPVPPFDTFLEYKNTYESEAIDLEFVEKVKLTWLTFAAPAVSGASTIASCVGLHTVHTKRANAMAALYAVSQGKMDEYAEKAEKALGPKKTQDLTNELAQSEVDKQPLGDHELILTDKGGEICYDDWGGRYFTGSLPVMERAINEGNRRLLEEGDLCLNDLYEYLGLSPVPMGESLGWSGKVQLVGKYGTVTTGDGRAALSVRFHPLPKANLGHQNGK